MNFLFFDFLRFDLLMAIFSFFAIYPILSSTESVERTKWYRDFKFSIYYLYMIIILALKYLIDNWKSTSGCLSVCVCVFVCGLQATDFGLGSWFLAWMILKVTIQKIFFLFFEILRFDLLMAIFSFLGSFLLYILC